MDRRLASANSLWMATRVCLEEIPSVDEALHDLGNFVFVALDLFYADNKHPEVFSELLRLVKRP